MKRIALMLAGALLWGDLAAAQEVNNVFFPAPREQRQRLSRAARALEEGSYAEAVVALGELLAGTEDGDLAPELQQQDFFLTGTGTAGTRASLKAEAQRMLGEMPEKGRDLYEVRFGPQARAQLSKAIDQGDSQLMMDITRRYFHTRAGYEATMLLGRQYLGEGRPLAAAMNFQRISRWPAAQQRFEPQLSLLLATSWLQAGLEEKAQETLVSLRRRKPDAGFRIAGKNVTLFSRDSEALTWLRRWAKSEGMRRLDESQWVMHKGNARRNASSQGDLPLLNYRWRTRVVLEPDDEKLVANAKRQKRNQSVSTISSLQLLAVDDTVLMRSPDKLLAVDFKSGKRIWDWPWRVGGDPLEPSGTQPEGPRTVQLTQRVWDDASYGQMSSDGENLYFLNDLGYAATTGSPRVFVAGGGIMRVNPGAPKPYNQLMSLSLRREGAIRWNVGGKDGGFEEELAEAFFLGPPLPMQGRLYVLAELRGEIRLVVLNARDGSLIWQQQLAHLDNNTIVRTPGRRLTGASPSFSDGVLVCPTGAGAVVALDISTRSLLWGYQYASNIRKLQTSSSRQQVVERWIDSSPTIVDNQVLLTPPESNELHCLDLLTGEEARWSPLSRDDMLYVAGAEDGTAMVVGKRNVRGIRLSDGQPAWDPVDLGEHQPSGFGFLSDGHYYLPTSNKEILKVSLETGKVAERVPTNQELGNLVCYGDNILSQSSEWVSSYYQRTPLRENVAAKLKANPNDEWALARRCELLLQDGRKDEALEVLRRTHKLRPDDEAIRGLLVETLLSLLRSDFDKHSDLVDELGGLIERSRERAEFAKLRAIGLEKAGRIREAFQAAIELMPEDGSGATLEDVEEVLQVRRDRWVAARVAALTTAAKGEDRKHIDGLVDERLQAALKEGSPGALRRFLRGFAAHPLSRAARIGLARHMIESGELLAAELQLAGLDDGDDELAGQALALRAELLLSAKRTEAAADLYRRLAMNWPDLDLNGKPAKQVAAKALADPLAARARWPVGRVEARPGAARSGRRTSSYQRVYPVQMDGVYGPYEAGVQAVVDQRTNSLVIRDGMGRSSQQLSLTQGQRYYTSNYSLTRGRTMGHLMLITLGYELIAVDTLRSGSEGLLWRLPLYDALPGRTATINQIRPVQMLDPWGNSRMVAGDMSNRVLPVAGPSGRMGVIFQRMREVLCVDAISGETIWSRQNLLPAAELLGDEEVVIVAPPEGGEATVLSAIDGRVLGKRPIEPLRSRWASWGRNSLAFKSEGNDIVLRLYDVWTKEELWTGRFRRGSKGVIVGGDEFAILEPEGKLQVLSLKDGWKTLEAAVSREPQLNHLQVLRSKTQYLVVPSQAQSPESTGTIQPAPSGGYTKPMVNGRIYAFDRASGKPVWQSAATVEDYSLPAGQPSETPVLVLLRNERVRENGRLRQSYSALVLDRRDGHAIHHVKKVTGTLTLYEVQGRPEVDQVVLGLANTSTTLQFTDDPAPPEPPAQLGTSAVDAAENARNAVRRAADALFRNLVPVPVP